MSPVVPNQPPQHNIDPNQQFIDSITLRAQQLVARLSGYPSAQIVDQLANDPNLLPAAQQNYVDLVGEATQEKLKTMSDKLFTNQLAETLKQHGSDQKLSSIATSTSEQVTRAEQLGLGHGFEFMKEKAVEFVVEQRKTAREDASHKHGLQNPSTDPEYDSSNPAGFLTQESRQAFNDRLDQHLQELEAALDSKKPRMLGKFATSKQGPSPGNVGTYRSKDAQNYAVNHALSNIQCALTEKSVSLPPAVDLRIHEAVEQYRDDPAQALHIIIHELTQDLSNTKIQTDLMNYLMTQVVPLIRAARP